MAFVNEFMTVEEKIEFKAKEIPNPGNRFHTLKPYRWTINREQDVFLIWALTVREEPRNEHFLLGWKGTMIPVLLRKSLSGSATITWELISWGLPVYLKDSYKDVKQSLKEALIIYAFSGDPDDPRNQHAQVIFKF